MNLKITWNLRLMSLKEKGEKFVGRKLLEYMNKKINI